MAARRTRQARNLLILGIGFVAIPLGFAMVTHFTNHGSYLDEDYVVVERLHLNTIPLKYIRYPIDFPKEYGKLFAVTQPGVDQPNLWYVNESGEIRNVTLQRPLTEPMLIKHQSYLEH